MKKTRFELEDSKSVSSPADRGSREESRMTNHVTKEDEMAKEALKICKMMGEKHKSNNKILFKGTGKMSFNIDGNVFDVYSKLRQSFNK
jgi:hypothetical protein